MMETLNKSTLVIPANTQRVQAPESSQIKHLDPGFRRGDDLLRVSWGGNTRTAYAIQSSASPPRIGSGKAWRNRKETQWIQSPK
jgi:hypothetical protein